MSEPPSWTNWFHRPGMEFAVKKMQRTQAFSSDEISAIAAMHAELLESLRLAVTVFLNRDQKAASRLVARKASLREMETQATALHVRLLRDAGSAIHAGEGDALVAESRGLFLRIVCDLRRVHSHIATLAYPALNRLSRDSSSTPPEQGGAEGPHA